MGGPTVVTHYEKNRVRLIKEQQAASLAEQRPATLP